MNTFIELSNKGKHFTQFSYRISIEAGIKKGWSFKKIADELGKSPSSGLREVDDRSFPLTITMTAAAGKPSAFIFLPAPNRASATLSCFFALSVEAGNALLSVLFLRLLNASS